MNEMLPTPQQFRDSQVGFHRFEQELKLLSYRWQQSLLFSRENPHGYALLSESGCRTFHQLDSNVQYLESAMRARSLKSGDAVALMCRNRAEFVEVFLASMRCGLRLTPINTHLTVSEVRFILQDCQARVLFTERGLSGASTELDVPQRVIIESGATNTQWSNAMPETVSDSVQPHARPCGTTACGTLMLYTSGTTGRPKGVYKKTAEVIEPQYDGTYMNYRGGDVALCCGPAYHSAPLLFDIRWPLASGVPIIMMEKWDSRELLRLIVRYRVTHMHMVPTMFQRLMSINATERAKYDLSSLRLVIHGAAPCPVELKRAMIEWLGPILTEYYGATEGGHGINVDSHTWLRKPGTVGRLSAENGHCVLDENGAPVPAGTVGRVFLSTTAESKFEYFGDQDKTQQAYLGRLFTLGDLGYVDAEGYLFLSGRSAECIISGGVNIYPREIDEVLLRHDSVAEACTVGAPDAEWGERVVAAVVLRKGIQGSAGLADELIAHTRLHLAGFKCPREIVFDASLPYTGTGKLLRNQVRERFWRDQEQSIHTTFNSVSI